MEIMILSANNITFNNKNLIFFLSKLFEIIISFSNSFISAFEIWKHWRLDTGLKLPHCLQIYMTALDMHYSSLWLDVAPLMGRTVSSDWERKAANFLQARVLNLRFAYFLGYIVGNQTSTWKRRKSSTST